LYPQREEHLFLLANYLQVWAEQLLSSELGLGEVLEAHLYKHIALHRTEELELFRIMLQVLVVSYQQELLQQRDVVLRHLLIWLVEEVDLLVDVDAVCNISFIID